MTSLAQVTALVDAHVNRDYARFRAITLQIAADISSRSERGAVQLRKLIEKQQPKAFYRASRTGISDGGARVKKFLQFAARSGNGAQSPSEPTPRDMRYRALWKQTRGAQQEAFDETQAEHAMVQCTGICGDRQCGRQQAIALNGEAGLASWGWRLYSGHWLCSSCVAVSRGAS